MQLLPPKQRVVVAIEGGRIVSITGFPRDPRLFERLGLGRELAPSGAPLP